MVKIYSTKEILMYLDKSITQGIPFSTIRLGDAGLGILYSYFCDNFIETGKWSGKNGTKLSNKIMKQLTIPKDKIKYLLDEFILSINNATFCDTYDAYFLLNKNKKNVGMIGRNWNKIHKQAGLINTKYCSPLLHYFSIVNNEFNLFDIMKNRKVFCISNQIEICENLKEKSGATTIDYYKIPRQGIKGAHYLNHYQTILDLIDSKAKEYDLFLIGAGFLGKIYCNRVKIKGGRVFDSGRLFDFWSETRVINGRASKFLKLNKETMLVERLKKINNGVW